jgi:ABC-type uncharacterized transport system ATPase subunit
MTRPRPSSTFQAPGRRPSSPGLLVEMRGIGKRYSNGVVANESVDLTLHPGEIHALVGENGAGKSTLMSILYGLEEPTTGQILLNGSPVSFASPVAAARAGIGMVHQEFKLFPSLTVAENVVFRAEPTTGTLFLDRKAATLRVGELAQQFGLDVDPAARVSRLSVGVLQRVEILKALYRQAQVLILDEPTAVLTPQEVDALFVVLQQLRDAGRTIVVVTHKLREVMEFSDRITVLRDGRSVATMETPKTDATQVAHHMTGRNVDLDGRYQPGQPGEVALRVRDLTMVDDHGITVVKGASFDARYGEILGIAGVAGSGQTELLRAIAGLSDHETGSVQIDGTELQGLSSAQRRHHGIAYVPEDRRGVGSAVSASVAANLAMNFHRRPPIKKGWRLDHRAIANHARQIIQDFEIKVSRPDVVAGTLSGGNLQKVVVGRELAHGAAVLLVDQPTRGVDIGAIENIHARLRGYRDEGHAVVLTSAELSELFALADRILVMYAGEIMAEMSRPEATEAKVGLAMAGLSPTTMKADA